MKISIIINSAISAIVSSGLTTVALYSLYKKKVEKLTHELDILEEENSKLRSKERERKTRSTLSTQKAIKETEPRDQDESYKIISPYDFETENGYTKSFLYYYEEEGELVDEDDNLVDIPDISGFEEHFGDYSEDLVNIRIDSRKEDYEIEKYLTRDFPFAGYADE